MNIVKQQVDELNATLTVSVAKEDYEEKVLKTLKDFQKKAHVNGFRPGKVPMSYISKLYRVPVLVDEVSKMGSEKVNQYLKTENIRVLGDPLLAEVQKPIQWETDTEFEFVFDIGLAPAIEVKVSRKDKIDYYRIEVDESLINQTIESYLRRYGKFVEEQEVPAEAEEVLLSANIAQAGEGGIAFQDVIMNLRYDMDEEARKLFAGKKKGEKVIVPDIKKAFNNNEIKISSLLQIKKEEVAGLSGPFEFTLLEISRFEKAQVNQELFDKIWGEGQVHTEEEFRQRIVEDLKKELEYESDQRFYDDMQKYFLEKIKVNFPKDFLIRWLMKSSEEEKELSRENVEKGYPVFEEKIKWQLIQEEIFKTSGQQITEEDIRNKAGELAKAYFSQYGIYTVPDEYLQQHISRILSNKEDVRKILSYVMEDKVLEYVKNTVELKEKVITQDEFDKLPQ